MLISFSIISCGGKERDSLLDNEVEIDNDTESGIHYEIAEKNDIHLGNTKRYSWEVVVKEKVNVKQLEELSKKIIEIAKNEKPFNAIVIGFYDYEEYIGTGYTLGKIEYAPEGDWGKAGTVKTGEYDKMDYKYSLREKDWGKQLTREEVKVYKAWKDLFYEKDMGSELPDEDEVINEIAKGFDIEAEEVNAILQKQIVWIFDDKNN